MKKEEKDSGIPEADVNAGNAPTQNELPVNSASALIADGWREYPDQFRKYARCFYKRFDTPTPCAGNDDKPGMQVCVALYPGFAGKEARELDLVGGLPNGTWFKALLYGLPGTVEEDLALIPGLLATWEEACSANGPSVSNGWKNS